MDYCTLVLVAVLIPDLFAEEIYTLQRMNRLFCLTDQITSPVYVTPPKIGRNFDLGETDLLTNGNWTEDDWVLRNVLNSTQGPVLDARWQSFPTVYTSYLRFAAAATISFSVYAAEEFFIYISDNKRTEQYKEIIQRKGDWTHYNFIVKNEAVFYTQNGYILKKWDDMEPQQLVIRSPKKYYWKIHSYQFKVAHSVTVSNPTTLTVAPSGRSCLMLYTSICENCFLKVVLSNSESPPEAIIVNSTYGESSVTTPWQTHIINIKGNMETQMHFYRYVSNQLYGFWAMSVEMCPSIRSGLYLYKSTLPKSKIVASCRVLKNMVLSEETTDKNLFTNETCHPGMLGLHCNVSCSSILGRQFPHCEKHRICQGITCTCGWGYNGPLCERRCNDGRWGLSCQNKCETRCHKCNKISGVCHHQSPRQSLYKSKNVLNSLLENSGAMTVITCLIIIFAILATVITYIYIFYSLFLIDARLTT